MSGIRGRRRTRRDQPDQADIGAGADALQHHVAEADSRFGAALAERIVAHVVEAGLGEIAEAEQRTRGIADADHHAVAGEGGNRRLDALDQKLQPLDQRHGAADRFGGGNQDAMAAIGKFKPGAAAGDEHAQRRAEAAQPLHPDRAAQRQSSRELCHLAPACVRRTEGFLGEGCAIGRAEQFGADRIGPENPRAVDRPEPGGEGACRMDRQSRIADASQLEFRTIHRNDMIRLARRLPNDASGTGGQTMTALVEGQYRPRATAGPRPGGPGSHPSRDNLNPAEPYWRLRRWGCCKRRSKDHDGEPSAAASHRRSLLSIV